MLCVNKPSEYRVILNYYYREKHKQFMKKPYPHRP